MAGTSPKADLQQTAARASSNANAEQPDHLQDPVIARPQRHVAGHVRPTAAKPSGPAAAVLQRTPEPVRLPDPVPMKLDANLLEELTAARAVAEAAKLENARLAMEVERLRSALAQGAAARQQEVAEILQSAAAHQAVVSSTCLPPMG